MFGDLTPLTTFNSKDSLFLLGQKVDYFAFFTVAIIIVDSVGGFLMQVLAL